MKSICFIAPKAYQIFNPKIKSTFGGAEVQLYSLAKEISKNKNFDVNFMVADYGQKCMEEYEDVKVTVVSYVDNSGWSNSVDEVTVAVECKSVA